MIDIKTQFGALDWIRTSHPRLRRPILYPNELRAHLFYMMRFTTPCILPSACAARLASRLVVR